MSTVFSNEDNLPGVITEVENDYSYGYDTSLFGTTDSVVIIGTAFDGPVGLPTPVYSPEHAIYVFGKTYDSQKRQEATLVAGVQDAWDRGCRTIYAVRVGGKELYKDFKLAIDNGFRLRVSARYPSNIGKQVYMRYDGTLGAETMILYKPAARATIAEKKRGEVTSASAVMSHEIRLSMDYGMGRDSNLVDVIRLFNEDDANNVLELSIVDENGVDVTDSTEAYAIPLGAIFSGVYFIGRDESACDEKTKTELVIMDGKNAKPYSSFSGDYYRKLDLNTDVAQPYPIYFSGANRKEFTSTLRAQAVTMVKAWDFLKTANAADPAFLPNETDYEETNLSTFEVYKRLGSGFAITAKATKRTNSNGVEQPPRITETPMDDANRIQPILDGIYGALEDSEVKYRVITNVHADDDISSKLPRSNDFKRATANSLAVFKNYLVLTPKIDSLDLTNAKKYSIAFNSLKKDEALCDNKNDIYTDEVFPMVAKLTALTELKGHDFHAGDYVLVENSGNLNLMRIDAKGAAESLAGSYCKDKHVICEDKVYAGDENGIFTEVTFTQSSADESAGNYLFNNKEYILGEALDSVFVFQPKDTSTVKPLGDLSSMLGNVEDENAAQLRVFASSLPLVDNKIVVTSDNFSAMTLGELVETLNAHPIFSKIFEASLSDEGSEYRDEMITEIDLTDSVYTSTDEALNATYALESDRTIGYDYSLYIPYRTTDNFARQLAQHCTYVELKTAPAHGFIGCARQTDVSLTAVAKRVASLADVNFDLYAKNNAGRNLLDRNNYPYAIGRNVSVVFGQHFVTMENENYRYLSTGAASYAGMVSKLPLDQNSTSQSIDINALTFTLTPSQLVRLTKKGIVTFKQSFTKGIVVTDGITMAPVDSAYRRLAAWRVMGAVEELIRQAAEPYIGKQNHPANRNSLNTAIKSKLEKIKGTLIEAYSFDMIVDPKLLKFSYININYTIVPIYEIREIRNQISVKDSLDSADVSVT